MSVNKEADEMWKVIEQLKQRIDRLENIVLFANARGNLANNQYLQELSRQRNRLAAKADPLR